MKISFMFVSLLCNFSACWAQGGLPPAAKSESGPAPAKPPAVRVLRPGTNIAIPNEDAISTTTAIAISRVEKCPLRKLDMPSRYSQIQVINAAQNKNSGRVLQPAAWE